MKLKNADVNIKIERNRVCIYIYNCSEEQITELANKDQFYEGAGKNVKWVESLAEISIFKN